MIFFRAQQFVKLVCCLGVTTVAQAQEAITDSAGVRIYNYRALTKPPTAFVLAPTPTISIRFGRLDGMDVIGASAILRLRDGRLAVGVAQWASAIPAAERNFGSPPIGTTLARDLPPVPSEPRGSGVASIRIFDSTGKFVSRLGEFGMRQDQIATAPQILRELPNGNILVSTMRAVNSEFTRDGAFVKRVDFAVKNATVAGIFADFSSMVGHISNDTYESGANGARIRRISLAYELFDEDGTKIQTLPQTFSLLSGITLPGPPPAIPLAPWPIVPTPGTVAANEAIWHMDLVAWELTLYDKHGALRAIVRPPLPSRMAGAVLGGRYPRDSVYTNPLLIDNAGRLWMDSGNNNLSPYVEPAPRTWLVFQATGKLLGSVVIPAAFRPLTVQDNAVMGTARAIGVTDLAVVSFSMKAASR